MLGLIYYLAYGLNMLSKRMIERGIDILNKIPAILENNKKYKYSTCANIEEYVNSKVYGVLYSMLCRWKNLGK